MKGIRKEPSIPTTLHMNAKLRVKVDNALGTQTLKGFIEEACVLLLEKREGMAK